jgi:hypothetical protein
MGEGHCYLVPPVPHSTPYHPWDRMFPSVEAVMHPPWGLNPTGPGLQDTKQLSEKSDDVLQTLSIFPPYHFFIGLPNIPGRCTEPTWGQGDATFCSGCALIRYIFTKSLYCSSNLKKLFFTMTSGNSSQLELFP